MAKTRRTKITERQLQQILEEAARAWQPANATRLREVVSTAVSCGANDAAVAHALVHTLVELSRGRRAVHVLLTAVVQDFSRDHLLHQLPGPAWEKLLVDLDVTRALIGSAYGEDM